MKLFREAHGGRDAVDAGEIGLWALDAGVLPVNPCAVLTDEEMSAVIAKAEITGDFEDM